LARPAGFEPTTPCFVGATLPWVQSLTALATSDLHPRPTCSKVGSRPIAVILVDAFAISESAAISVGELTSRADLARD